jgi:hypothetical protein
VSVFHREDHTSLEFDPRTRGATLSSCSFCVR